MPAMPEAEALFLFRITVESFGENKDVRDVIELNVKHDILEVIEYRITSFFH
jgi:hypothetical protein